jgi:N-acetylglucosaminyl-diphospho-decaprenol L-rhamnosyltransferase
VDEGEPIASYGVVILYFRRGPQVMSTISSVRAQTVPPTRIVVVDNASEDGVLDALVPELQAAGAEIVRCSTNGGYSAGMNAGARELGTSVDHVLFLTHEVVMELACAERLLEHAEDDDVVLVGPSLHLPGGDAWSNGGRVTRFGAAGHMRGETSQDPAPADWLDGACLLARRDAMAAIGGFDERYFLYWEDVDFSLAMAAEGHVIVVPSATAQQAPTVHAPMYYYARNRLLLWRKFGRPFRVVASVPAILAFAAYRGLRGRPADVLQALRGIRDGLAGRGGPAVRG